jgi:hypothetical protein
MADKATRTRRTPDYSPDVTDGRDAMTKMMMDGCKTLIGDRRRTWRPAPRKDGR